MSGHASSNHYRPCAKDTLERVTGDHNYLSVRVEFVLHVVSPFERRGEVGLSCLDFLLKQGGACLILSLSNMDFPHQNGGNYNAGDGGPRE